MTDIVEHAAALLRDDADPAVPVGRLYAEIEASMGPQPGGPPRLCERLRQAPDRFVLIERQEGRWSAPFDDTESEGFRDALRRAGIETEPRVMLRVPTPDRNGALSVAEFDAAIPGPVRPDAAGALKRLRASLAGLVVEAGVEPTLHDELVEALDRAAELRRALMEQPAGDDPGFRPVPRIPG